MKIIQVEQNTPEWLAAKCGIPSSSNFDKIVTSKGERSKQRDKYLYRLAGERITKIPEETYQNENMQRGKQMEQEGRSLYEVMINATVRQVGFCVTEGKTIYGASPDGLVGKLGGLEIKCPLVSTHVSYLLKGTLPMDYFQQCQGQLLVTGRKWLDFMSYSPGLKPLIVRVKPHKLFLPLLKAELELFCLDLDKIVRRIK